MSLVVAVAMANNRTEMREQKQIYQQQVVRDQGDYLLMIVGILLTWQHRDQGEYLLLIVAIVAMTTLLSVYCVGPKNFLVGPTGSCGFVVGNSGRNVNKTNEYECFKKLN